MRTRAQGSEARAYPGFLSVEACLGVLLLSPERYASPSQGSPSAPNSMTPVTGEESQNGVNVFV